MKVESPPAEIQHRIAELRAAYPRIADCRAALDHWLEGGRMRHALRIDLRWPQHQSLIAGPACDTAEAALQAGFEGARQSLTRHA